MEADSLVQSESVADDEHVDARARILGSEGRLQLLKQRVIILLEEVVVQSVMFRGSLN